MVMANVMKIVATYWLIILQVTTQEVPDSWDWIWRVFNSAGIIALLGLITQYVVPRLRKLKDRADVASTNASTAITQFEWYKGQLTYLQDRVDDMETKYNLSNGYINAYRAHVHELYVAIGMEPAEIEKRIKARLRTKRPNGIYLQIQEEEGNKKDA